MDSVTEPIWFTFNSSALQAFFSSATLIFSGLVTSKSSPTTCTFSPTRAVKAVYPSQSS